MDDIVKEFNLTLDKISREGDVYVEKIQDEKSNLAITANFYELIQ